MASVFCVMSKLFNKLMLQLQTNQKILHFRHCENIWLRKNNQENPHKNKLIRDYHTLCILSH